MSHVNGGVRPHAIVIGAGIGGTALSVLLAYAGLRVTLLEKNRYLGGACAGYEKQGFQIDFGAHLFSRGARGPLGQVIERVGRPNEIEFRHIPEPVELRWPDANQQAGYASVRPAEQFDLMQAMVMIQEMGLSRAEVDDVMRMLALSEPGAADDVENAWLYRSVTEFIAHHTGHPRLSSLITILLGALIHLPPEDMSAGEAIYCLRRMVMDNSISYPRGGAKAVPLTYCRIAEEHGAQIRTGTAVRRILIADGRAHGVELADGTPLDADLVISTSSVRTTALHLCDPADLPPSYVDAAKAVRGSLSGVLVKIALDTKLVQSGLLFGVFSDTQDMLHAKDNLGAALYRDVTAGKIPDVRSLFCPIPTNYDPDLAPPGHQLLTARAVAPTTDIDLADSPAAWEESLLRTVRRIVPGLDEHTLFVDRTTVRWMEHWIGKDTGPTVSTGQTPWQIGEHRPSVRTPVDGLYLAGDCAGGRGIGTELAADSAMECAERILTDLHRTTPASWHRSRHDAPTVTAFPVPAPL
jgi:prolycopene isomerase